MSTVVFLHAHPDDEAIATGGTMRLLANAGHRIVLVCATRGEVGKPVDGVLSEGESLGDRRSLELAEAGSVLGVARLEFLDYCDSGMMGERTNRVAGSFWMCDVDEASARFAAIVKEESADLVVCYDPHGGYGHPDHIQVHRVGTIGARMAGDLPVLWASMNATRMRDQIATFTEHMDLDDSERPNIEDGPFGLEEDELTHEVDVSSVVALKREAMAIHESQISGDSFFMTMPEEAFAAAFGAEFFCNPREAPSNALDGDILSVLESN
ncbi:MAG: PIG-L family deacetylase [Acidobacteria bacterium]|nr:PIG-L family deacetylase [Acidobacteriota bacterium]